MADPESPLVGADCKLYRNTGTVASPTWTEIDEIGDLSLNGLGVNLAEIKRRANSWTKNLAALFSAISIEFTLMYGFDATTFDALRANFFAKTVEEWAVFDGPIATTDHQGLRVPVVLSEFPINQPLEEAVSQSVVASIAYMVESATEVDPSWLQTA